MGDKEDTLSSEIDGISGSEGVKGVTLELQGKVGLSGNEAASISVRLNLYYIWKLLSDRFMKKARKILKDILE